MNSPTVFPDPLELRQGKPLVSPSQHFDYHFHPMKNYIHLIYHEYFQQQLPHLSQNHRYRTKVPQLGTKRKGIRDRRYALNIIDNYLPPDMVLLAYDYVLNCPKTLDLNLNRTHISKAVWQLLRFEEQRVLLECFFITNTSLKKIENNLVHTPVSVRLSYEDIRTWYYFFFNLNPDTKGSPAYPRQMLHLYLRRLQAWFSRPNALSERPDPRTGQPFSLADIYATPSAVVPLRSYTYQMEMLAGTQPITDTLSAYKQIFLKPLRPA
ncbi:MAG: hypothetical protein KAV87_45645 [Desulfobacteraceae bacterium]|nr:hypothetical protein [Desulfobacteraceae bacterium]